MERPSAPERDPYAEKREHIVRPVRLTPQLQVRELDSRWYIMTRYNKAGLTPGDREQPFWEIDRDTGLPLSGDAGRIIEWYYPEGSDEASGSEADAEFPGRIVGSYGELYPQNITDEPATTPSETPPAPESVH